MKPSPRSSGLLLGGRRSLALLLVSALVACGGFGAARTPAPDLPAGLTSTATPVTNPVAQVVRSEHGAVAAASVWAAEAGATILAQGGNAADAAVAAAWALAVTEPSMSGLGGRASIVVRTAGGELSGIDGLNQVPRSYREGVAPAGYDRAAIPGVPAALARLHAEHGSWPMARLLEPAIRLAEAGFELPEPEAERFAGAAEDLRLHPAALGTYLQPDGSPWPAGTLFRQPELARTLRALATEGVEVFYRGWVADSIDADMRRVGGFITRDELAGYEALPALPVEGVYRGHRIHSNFRPASGHAVIQALQTLEAATPSGAPRATASDAQGGARWAALLGQVMEQAIGERGRVVDGSEAASARLLTSLEHARSRAAEIRMPPAAGAAARSSGPSATPTRPIPLYTLHGRAPLPGMLVTDPRDREATTHMTVIDASGMVVSLTQSLGPSMGARVVAPGLGFVYATRLGSVPGSRPGSTIAPTLVLRPDGSLLAGLGGAGDARIISAVIQTVSRMVDHGLPLDAAVAAPRVHPDGELRLRVEEGPVGMWSTAEREALEAWGFELVPSPSGYFGRVHAVGWEPGSMRGGAGVRAFGVAEPRWNGSAVAPRGAPPGG
jgi:gamma-glutamyltranspeptidase / glutathione hydrolase